MKKILFCASEAAPFSKTGGLADVAGSLPKEVNSANYDVRLITPLHKQTAEKFGDKLVFKGSHKVRIGSKKVYVGVFEYVVDGFTCYFVDNEFYFKNRDSLYGDFDDGERYVYFAKAILSTMKEMDFKPDVIHMNDWQTAGVAPLLDDFCRGDEYYWGIKTVLTIHNLRYQGVYSKEFMYDVLNLPSDFYTENKLKFYDGVNLLKGGINLADVVTTVSESYADEIMHKYFGENLQGVLKNNKHKVVGILNGIDYSLYNPSTDKHIEVNYDGRSIDRKKENKVILQKKYGLPVDPDVPVIGMVTRLDSMKGIDLILHILDELLEQNIQIILLGTGDKDYENDFKAYEKKYKKKVAARIYFSGAEANQIYASSDIFLMPSMFEPCGLSQIIALKYGTIPVVHAVGGLKDTIKPYNPVTKEGNGFTFESYNAHDLLFSIKRALDVYNSDNKSWKELVKAAMKYDYSWKKSSQRFKDIYKNL